MSRPQLSSATYGIYPPGGVEKIKLFVSTRPIDPLYLSFDGAQTDASQAPETLSPLDVVIARAVGKRGESKSSDPIDLKTWATSTREIRIREK